MIHKSFAITSSMYAWNFSDLSEWRALCVLGSPTYIAKIVGVTPTQSTEVSQGTPFHPLERPATPQNLGICAASDTNAPCDTYDVLL